MAHVTQT